MEQQIDGAGAPQSTNTMTTDEEQNYEAEEHVYIAWPQDTGCNDELNTRAFEQLVAIAGASKTETSESKSLGVNFWRVKLNEEQFSRALQIPEVRNV